MPQTEAMITAWVAGPRALLMQDKRKAAGNADALLEMCLTTLANAFDLPLLRLQKQLLSWHTHDWQADPMRWVPTAMRPPVRSMLRP